MREFVQSGGNIIFLGEVNNFLMSNWYINSALSQVGSTLRIVNQSDFDGGGGFTTITGPQITDDTVHAGASTRSHTPSRLRSLHPTAQASSTAKTANSSSPTRPSPAPASAAMIPFAFAVCTRRRR